MRLVVIDSETTGLSPEKGDRMVEIAAVVIEDGQIQIDQTFHRYIDPLMDIPDEVVRIHGIDAQKLATKHAVPFAEIGREFLEFIADSTLVFHNAPFDLGFINHELRRAKLPDTTNMPVIDSLIIARQRYPKLPNNLDALCDRLHIDRSQRQLHGALIDATLTAHAYLAMINHDSEPYFNSTPSEIRDDSLSDQKISELILNSYDELEYRHSNKISPNMPRFLASDRHTEKAHRSELITITGESRMQLSAITAGIVNHAAFHAQPPANVIIFSLVMSALDWSIDLLASEAHIKPDRTRTGNLRPKDWRDLATASGRMMDGKLHICDTKTINLMDIQSKCHQIHLRDGGLDLIIIDDFQTITANETDAEHHTSDLTRALQSLSVELNASIILLSPLQSSDDP